MSMCDRRICTVGYALNAKKLRQSDNPGGIDQQWKGGGLADIVNQTSHTHVEGVKFSPWMSSSSTDKQSEHDVIIHKLTEEILSDPYGKRLTDLRAYLELHPKTVIIDPIEAVERVLSRSSTCNRLRQIEYSSPESAASFTIPNFVVLDGRCVSSEEILARMKEANMDFPVSL
jgi:hypothetical protein